jgi:DNA replication protein DnaC
LRYLAQPELLIIDEVGYIPFARAAANLFFQVVKQCYP